MQNKQNLDINLGMGDDVICRATSTKFLGLLIDENLNWKEQCAAICSKLGNLCFLIRNIRTVLSDKQVMYVYNAYVGSRLHYGICFWGASSASTRVFLSQKRVVRCLLGMDHRDSCRGKFRQLNILTVTGVFLYEICKYIFQSWERFPSNTDFHEHYTRKKDDFHTVKCRLNISKHSPHHLGLSLFNKLPCSLRSLNNFKSFKRQLKCFLVQNEFYSLNEYNNQF